MPTQHKHRRGSSPFAPKSPIQGIVDRGNSYQKAPSSFFPPTSTPGLTGGGNYQSVILTQSVSAAWRDVQPAWTAGSSAIDTSSSNPIIAALAALPSGMRIVIRIFCAWRSPDALKTAVGSFYSPVESPSNNLAGWLPAWWTSGYVDAWRYLMIGLAALFDADARVAGIVIAPSSMDYPEETLRDDFKDGSVDAQNAYAVLPTPYSLAADMASITDAIDIHKTLWRRTHGIFQVQPMLFLKDETTPAASPTNDTYGTGGIWVGGNNNAAVHGGIESLCQYARSALGTRAYLGGTGTRIPSIHLLMENGLQALGPPYFWQTATNVNIGTTTVTGDRYQEVFQDLVNRGCNAIEIPWFNKEYAAAGAAQPTYVKYRLNSDGLDGYNNAAAKSLSFYDTALRANPTS
jgi:hypothetical protein